MNIGFQMSDISYQLKSSNYKLIIVCFLLLFCLISCGAKQTDLIKKTKSDSRDMLQRGNDAYRQGRYKESARYYDRARMNAISIDDLVVRADADNNFGHLFLLAGNLKDAHRKFEEAKVWSETINYKIGFSVG